MKVVLLSMSRPRCFLRKEMVRPPIVAAKAMAERVRRRRRGVFVCYISML